MAEDTSGAWGRRRRHHESGHPAACQPAPGHDTGDRVRRLTLEVLALEVELS
jgi:hypothetical protein